MSMQFAFDIRSWLFGFVCSRYKLLISIGPVSIWFSNDKRYYADMARAYEMHQQAEAESNAQVDNNRDSSNN